jgi:hypothetical protein
MQDPIQRTQNTARKDHVVTRALRAVHAGSGDAGSVAELPGIIVSFRPRFCVEELRASRHPALEIESARVFSRRLIASHVDASLNEMIGRSDSGDCPPTLLPSPMMRFAFKNVKNKS